jgi:HSP90 family molecular chaperone
VKKYSEFINYPIKLYLSKDVRETVEDTEAKPEESKDSETKIEDEENFINVYKILSSLSLILSRKEIIKEKY